MKKLVSAAFLVAATAVASPAVAANLSNGSGQSCGDDVGTWHFVNNQTGGSGPGVLVAVFATSGGTAVYVTGPDGVNKNNQHFYVTSTGTLVSAETNLDGRLVLSDFSCEDGGKKDPKK